MAYFLFFFVCMFSCWHLGYQYAGGVSRSPAVVKCQILHIKEHMERIIETKIPGVTAASRRHPEESVDQYYPSAQGGMQGSSNQCSTAYHLQHGALV